MKNRTVILILSVLAVAMWTAAVINFCLGNVLGGITDVLMACFGALMAYALWRVGQLGRLADGTRKAVIGLLEMLTKGVPATLTVKDGKGVITLGHGEDGDADAGEAELGTSRDGAAGGLLLREGDAAGRRLRCDETQGRGGLSNKQKS